MIVLIFVIGALLGILLGGTTCVRYLRREIAADVGPQLKGIQLQLDRMDAELSLANAERLNEIAKLHRS